MPLFDHLGELRRRLTIVVVSVFAAAIVLYFATPVVLDILEDPIRSFVPDGKFYITTTLGGFGLRFSLAIKMAVVMCTPMIIWQILAFFLPALRPNERKWVVPTVLASTVLFFLGAIFCYFIIIPRRLLQQPSTQERSYFHGTKSILHKEYFDCFREIYGAGSIRSCTPDCSGRITGETSAGLLSE